MGSILEEARRLGRLFGLLSGAYLLFVIIVAMLSQFGLPEAVTTFLVVLVTIVTYVVMGVVTRTLSLPGFFLADRFVPAGLNGMAAASAFLAFPFIGLAGAFLADSRLGLAIVAGLVAGFVLLAVVVAPYYRKSGALSVPDYLTVRFGHPLIRPVAVLFLAISAFPVLVASLRLATDVAVATLGFAPRVAAIAILAILLVTTLLGGLRSTTLTAGTQAIVALIAVLVPAALLSFQEYGLPLPQVTFGYALAETAAEPAALVVARGSALPLTGLDGFNMLALALCIAAGIAALPQIVIRFGASPGVSEARRSAGWALLIVALIAMTAPALAAFVRLAILRDVVGVELADLPQWIFTYGTAGLVEICGAAPISPAAIGTACGAGAVVNGLLPSDIALGADVVTLGFAEITGLPHVLTALIATGAIAVSLAAGAAALITLAGSLGNDLLARIIARRASAGRRLLVARVVLIGAALAASWLAWRDAESGFAWAAAALSIAGASFFPAFVLGVFWRRTTWKGALAGMVAGGGISVAYVALIVAGIMAPVTIPGLTAVGLSPAASGIIGIPLGFIVAVAVSLAGTVPGPGRQGVIDAIRRPNPDPILEDHAT